MKKIYSFTGKASQLYQKASLFFLVLLTPAALSSCMHIMMGSEHEGNSNHTDAVQEKEVRAGKFKVTAIFPAMQVGEESLITTSIMNLETGLRSQTAEVVFNVHPGNSMVDHSAMHMEHGKDSAGSAQASVGKESHQQLSQASEQGSFTFSYTPESEGEYVLRVTVYAIDEICLDEPFVVETTKKTARHDSSRSMGMTGSATTIGIVAVAVMATMMLFTWMK